MKVGQFQFREIVNRVLQTAKVQEDKKRQVANKSINQVQTTKAIIGRVLDIYA